MELDHLREYAVLAETCSFTLAARELGLTQSALSKHIARLEREFDSELVTRSTKGVSLTEAGKILYSQAKEVCRTLAQTKRSMQKLRRGNASGLVVDESALPNPSLRAQCRSLAERFGLDAQEQAALVLFLEELPFARIEEELGIDRDELAEVLARSYRKMGATSKVQALSIARGIEKVRSMGQGG